MKIAMVVTGGLHPSGDEQVVPSWLALFERLAQMHEIHAFALKHLAQPKTYPLRGLIVHDLGRPSAPLGLSRRVQERALNSTLESSLHEAAGVSVLEAAAAGVLAVGTLAGHIADWSPSKAVAVGDAIPESLADAIVSMHADADRRRSMAALAKTFSIAHDATYSAAKFDELYRNLRT